MLPEYDFSFQVYPKHDAHVQAYNKDFLSQLLNTYKQHWMLRDMLHTNLSTVGVDPASSKDSSSFWYEYGKDNFFHTTPTKTSEVAKLVSSSFRELTDSIDTKLTELGISLDIINADCKTSNSYMYLSRLKARPKSPELIYPSNFTMSRSTIGDMRAADLEKNDSPTLRNNSLDSDTTISDALRRSIKFAQQLPMFSVSNVKVHDSFCIDRASVYCSTIPYTEDKDTKLNQTYKKRKHIPNNQEEQKARKAKLLAKNKFFK